MFRTALGVLAAGLIGMGLMGQAPTIPIANSQQSKPTIDKSLSQPPTLPAPATLTPTPSADSATNEAPAPSTLSAPTSASNGKRLKLTVTITDPSDLKVRQGSTVQAGDILADRDRERQRLQSQKSQLAIALERIKATKIIAPALPRKVPAVADLPPVSYEQAKSEIDSAQLDLDTAREALALQQRKVDAIALLPESEAPSAIASHEQYVQDRLERSVSEAESKLSLVKSKLVSANEARQYDEYRASLEAARRIEESNQAQLAYNRQVQESQQQIRDRDYQASQLAQKLGDVDGQLAALAQVRSPFSGVIRRVKFLSQTNGELNVELILIAKRD